MGFDLTSAQLLKILEPQKGEYSDSFLKTKQLKPSHLGLGGIPPQADGLAGIATREIIRSHVISFALIRRLRFGKGAEGDAAIRVLVMATLLNAMARSDSELYLRANCHLAEASAPVVRLDRRQGDTLELAAITIQQADLLLEQAYGIASGYGVEWQGTTLHVTGNPTVFGAAADGDGN